jgi:hypothetical protein
MSSRSVCLHDKTTKDEYGVEGKRGRGRPRINYIQQLTTRVDKTATPIRA